MEILVTEYDPGWEEAYRRAADRIQEILGRELVAIHHIGSTSVPGLVVNRVRNTRRVRRKI